MSNKYPTEDLVPWYRQFWPWVLILLPASVVVAGITTAYIAYDGADDMVIDEYYKEGLAVNRKLEKLQRAKEMQISAALEFSGKDVRVLIAGPVTSQQLTLQLSHPLEADQDFTVPLIQSTPGIYLGRLSGSVFPRWHWTLELEDSTGWRLNGSVTAKQIDRTSDN